MKIISPAQFNTALWKNGKGETTELAISLNSTLQDFDWRLSMASVSENGEFSNFSGYERHLVLLEGKGMELCHNQKQRQSLRNPLEFAAFSGASSTFARLYGGQIIDFNLISRQHKYRVSFNTYPTPVSVNLQAATLSFVYSLEGTSEIQNLDTASNIPLPQKHLLLAEYQDFQCLNIVGRQLIVIQLYEQ